MDTATRLGPVSVGRDRLAHVVALIDRNRLVKWFYRTGPAEAHHYAYLAKQQALIPRVYGVLRGSDDREMIFLEYLDPAADPYRLLKDDERFREFLALSARFNSIQPLADYAAQLPRSDVGQKLHNSLSTLDHLWDHACKGELGDALAQFCSRGDDKLSRLRRLAKRLVEPVSQMEIGLIHNDFYPPNCGWSRDTGELLVFELEFVALGPRFYDVARWLGAPNDIEPRCRPREELAEYYLELYVQRGGTTVSLDQLLKETSILWTAQKLTDMNFGLGRALDGHVDWTDDRQEGRRVFREWLHKDLCILPGFIIGGPSEVDYGVKYPGKFLQ